jgi:outer membrane protein TolC
MEVAAERGPEPARLELAVAELRHPLLSPRAISLDDGIDPEEAALIAAIANPELAAARAERGEAEAGLLAAGLLPNPDFGAELLEPYGPNAGGLILSRTLSLSIDTATLVTRPARVATARSEAARVDLGIAWQEWEVAESARLDAVRLLALRRRMALVASELDFLEGTTRRLEASVARGDGTLQDLGVQRAALEAARAVGRELETAESSAESALLAQMGLPPDAHLDLVPTPAGGDGSAPRATTDALVPVCLERRLDLEALRRGYDAKEAALRQAVLEQFPTLSIGVSHQRNEDDVRFLGGFVTVGIPAFDFAHAHVALALATRERLAREYEARVLAVRQEIDALTRSRAIADRQLEQVDRSLPELAALEHAERAAADRGDVDRVAYQAVRASLFELRMTREALVQARDESAIGLEIACGGRVDVLAEARP